MSYLISAPDLLAAAAGDLAGIGSEISAANDATAAATTMLLPAASDEVSRTIAALFGAYADEFQMVNAHGAAFHEKFVRAVNAGAASYARAESANAASVQHALNLVNRSAQAVLAQPTLAAVADETGVVFIMGGTFNSQPLPGYIAALDNLYIQPNPAYTGFTALGLFTPETTGGFGITAGVTQGEFILNNAILTRPPGSHTLVFGYSQSGVIATLEMRALDTLPADQRPSPSDLSFMIIGNGDTPNGGIFSRFSGLRIAAGDISFVGAMPPNTPYPTTIYTLEYDGLANFPQYPLDVVADLNALAGAALVHTQYAFLTPDQLQSAVPLATSPGYYENGGVTHYYMIPDQNLPLLAPLRAVPVVGTPLADLLQPDLRVLVNLGYNPNGYANVPTQAQLFPGFSPAQHLLNSIPAPYNELISLLNYPPLYPPSPPPNFNPVTIAEQLVLGAQQGFTDALVDIGVLPSSYYATTYPAINDVAEMTAVAQ